MNKDLKENLETSKTAKSDVLAKHKEQIPYIKRNCPASVCNKQYIRHLNGEKLTRAEAMLGKCADCMNNFEDGRSDCNVPHCTLYPFMPYRRKK